LKRQQAVPGGRKNQQIRLSSALGKTGRFAIHQPGKNADIGNDNADFLASRTPVPPGNGLMLTRIWTTAATQGGGLTYASRNL
jgi:hypothetical protein